MVDGDSEAGPIIFGFEIEDLVTRIRDWGEVDISTGFDGGIIDGDFRGTSTDDPGTDGGVTGKRGGGGRGI